MGGTTYTVNNANQLTTISGSPNTTFTYDNNGNTATKVDGTGTTTYTWNSQNQMKQVSLPGGATVTFKYDPFGRRVQKATANGTINYLYDGDNVTEELDSTGGVVAKYAQGSGIDQPVAMLRGGTTSFYEADGLGSITSLTDNAGAIANSYTYESFGKLSNSTGTVVNPFRHAAREFEGDTDSYFYRARYYSHIIGRFLQEDPIRFSGGDNNFFRYVKQNPATFSDPYGLRVLNPDNYPVSPAVMTVLEDFNQQIGCDKDVVITGGNRPSDSTLGAGSNSTHVAGLAADINVPGQSHLATANQAALSGLFDGIGWYEEGYSGPNGEGPHVHVDLRGSRARWGYSATGERFRGRFPFAPVKLNPSSCKCK